jgi:uncharacterized protein (DUF2249 family)
MVIRRTDRVSAVLERHEGLIEVFTALAPAFERLRSPALRRVMARLVTVEQAARIAGVDADVLVARLNEGRAAPGGDESMPTNPGSVVPAAEPRPAALAAIHADNIVELDVREDLRAGREPFSRIMEARRRVPGGGALRLRAIFEPVPLYGVLARHGFAHWTERHADDDWVVWFYPDAAEAEREEAPAGGCAGCGVGAAAQEPDVRVLDVRGLEPPEPMVRTLAALELLPAGATLVQINERVPQFLLPQLTGRGFTFDIHEEPAPVRIFIRRASEPDTSPQESSTMQTRVLDVRIIPPREKHPSIFALFAALEPGESFILVNDHDPKPLRYQFEYEHAGEFGWRYLEEGPEVWRVEISKVGG